MQRYGKFIHERLEWPNFTWDGERIWPLLSEVKLQQGLLLGRMQVLGFELQDEANLATTTVEIIKSSEIEGEILDPEQVRSSLARRLGMPRAGLVASNRYVDGAVDLLLDATQNAYKDLNVERLFSWHAALFPLGRSGMYRIIAGNWRDDTTGPMQVVSGAMGKEKVHFEAPAAVKLPQEMEQFLSWLNTHNPTDDWIIRAAIAHLWFVTIHPFEDGNGRIARAISEMLLTRADGVVKRYYSMSSQIRKERKSYYRILEETQRGKLDITEWLEWFLTILQQAITNAEDVLEKVILKHRFWLTHGTKTLNDRQRKMLDKLLDDFVGKLTTRKWAKITKTSHDTALRDIKALIDLGIMRQEAAGGRSTNYELIPLE